MRPATKCKSCGAAIVYLTTWNDAWIPVNLDTWSPADGSIYNPARHIAHFATCPNAERHRRRRSTREVAR